MTSRGKAAGNDQKAEKFVQDSLKKAMSFVDPEISALRKVLWGQR
jgi:hypothetical protein